MGFSVTCPNSESYVVQLLLPFWEVILWLLEVVVSISQPHVSIIILKCNTNQIGAILLHS